MGGGMNMMKGKPSDAKLVVVAVVVVMAVVGGWEVKVASGAPTVDECQEEKRLAINACMPVMYGKLPTAACCERARLSHVECICPVITPKLAALINVNRAVRLIQGCGRPVPRHYKCGSITTP